MHSNRINKQFRLRLPECVKGMRRVMPRLYFNQMKIKMTENFRNKPDGFVERAASLVKTQMSFLQSKILVNLDQYHHFGRVHGPVEKNCFNIFRICFVRYAQRLADGNGVFHFFPKSQEQFNLWKAKYGHLLDEPPSTDEDSSEESESDEDSSEERQ